MAEKALPMRIKPPRHYYSWQGDIPSYPGIGIEEAADRLLHPSLEKRGLERVRIDDLRGLLEEVSRRDPDPDEFHRLYFNGVVINCFGDLRGMELPFGLGFAGAYFLDDLDLGQASIEALSISGHYIHGSLSLVNLRGSPRVDLQNVQADQVYVYGGDFSHLHFGGLKAGSVTVGQCSVDRRLEFRQGCEFYDHLWFDQLTLGGGLYVSDSRTHELFRVRHIQTDSSLEVSESHLAGPFEVQDSSCRFLSLRETIVSSMADLRELEFDEIDVLGAQLPGRILVEVGQLRRSDTGLRSTWDTPSKMEGAEADPQELSAAADQLAVLRERFHSMPSMTKAADYCAYRMKEITRILSAGRLPHVLGFLEKWALGYMIVLERLVGAAVIVVLLFTALYGSVALLGSPHVYGDVLFSDPLLAKETPVFELGFTWGWVHCFYLSVAAFGSVSVGMLTPVGYVAGLTAVETVLGGIWIAVFVVALARRVLRW